MVVVLAALVGGGTKDYHIARAPPPATPWDCATQMREIAAPVPADVSDFYFAEKYRPLHGDLEDDLILAGCARARANYLVTTDRQLLRHADISAKTPAEMLALLEAGLARGNAADSVAHDNAYYLRTWLAGDEA